MIFFLRNANLVGVRDAIVRARWDLLMVAAFVMALTYVVRVLRWQYLMRPVGRVGFTPALQATIMGFAATALLPGRVGELLRPYALARSEGFSASAVFGTIVVERLLDMVAVLLIFGVGIFLFDPQFVTADSRLLSALWLGAGLAGGFTVGVLGIACLAAGRPEQIGRMVPRASAWLPGRVIRTLSTMAQRFAQGLAIMRQFGAMLVALSWSVAVWLIVAASLWLVSAAFGVVLPPAGTATVLILTVVGVAVPTPAGIGGYHAAYELGTATWYGASTDAAVGAALVSHAISFAPVTLIGIVLMARKGIQIGRIGQLVSEDVAPNHESENRSPDGDHWPMNGPTRRGVAGNLDDEESVR